jgi:type VI secretion system protein ImpI
MELIFEIVSYHRLSPEQTSKMSISNTLTFGRSENNDWHLPDPEKIVSGHHARVEKRADGFYIYDLSTNGLYINRAVEALGTTNTHKLCEGDLLTFGDYEVSVSLVNKAVTNEAIHSTPSIAQPSLTQSNKPIISSPVQGIVPSTLFGDQPLVPNNASNILVTNDLNDHFDVPQPIPEEWDTNILKSKMTNNPVFDEPVKPASAPSAPLHTETAIPVKPVETTQKQYKSPVAATNTNFDAFIKGLGISELIKSEQLDDELLFEMGQSMQLMLMGLVESLRTRSALKSEFRINQTTFQQQENNPLKFSATIDDVFHNLFLKRSSSFLPSSKAITEAFNDTKKHDIALTAGTMGAIEGIFKQLAPTEIEKKDLKDSVFDQLIPGQKQLRYWKTYQSLHKDMVNEIAANGSSVLSDDFVRAYDKKIKSL